MTLARAAALALGTLVSEDLTLVAAGALVADGGIGFAAAALACLAGILGGDLLLFAAGRWFGGRALAFPPLRRLLSDAGVERASRTLHRHGALVAFTARLVPGTRVATYVAAGALRVEPWKFTVCLAVAAAVWTLLIIGLSVWLGAEVVRAGVLSSRPGLGPLLAALAAAAAALRIAHTAASWRGRRRLIAGWRRVTRWEFWPPYVFYAPLALPLACLMLKSRSATVFTAANPGIVHGGFVGESKFEILRALHGAGDLVARATLIEPRTPPALRVDRAERFMREHDLAYPVVVKPDQGQRGSGVTIVYTREELAQALTAARVDVIVQEYAPGREFGVFYTRRPSERRGRISSLTEKRFPSVTGDGRRSVADLILADNRAAVYECVHRRHRAALLDWVPPAGEELQLGDVRSHCRGSLFLDATPSVTPALEEAFDTVAARFDGFHFGRFDVRVTSVDRFLAGTGFKIVELNGVTAEPAHIYDPASGVWTAYRVLSRQWRLAFDIGAENRRRGAKVSSLTELAAAVQKYRRVARLHPHRRA